MFFPRVVTVRGDHLNPVEEVKKMTKIGKPGKREINDPVEEPVPQRRPKVVPLPKREPARKPAKVPEKVPA